MKKFLVALLIPLCFFACKPCPTQPVNCDCDSAAIKNNYPKMDEALVSKMVNYYVTQPHNIDTNIVRMITMNSHKLRRLLCDQNDLRLITASYLDSAADHKMGDMTIILQLWPVKGDVVYYDIKDVFGKKLIVEKTICPPPINCSITSPPSNN